VSLDGDGNGTGGKEGSGKFGEGLRSWGRIGRRGEGEGEKV